MKAILEFPTHLEGEPAAAPPAATDPPPKPKGKDRHPLALDPEFLAWLAELL